MTKTDYNARILFHADEQIMEIDFSNLTFDRSKKVNAFYDEIDKRIEATRQKWFFLVNYLNCKIMSEAWIAFAHRGKVLNLGYSLGSVRFAANPDTWETIVEKSREEHFDPNLFPSREAAVADLRRQRAKIADADFADMVRKRPEAPTRPDEDRVMIHGDMDTVEVDLSGYTFASSADVNRVFDAIDARVGETGRKWYFMMNFRDTEILPDAWYRWAVRSRRLGTERSLATLRYNLHDPAIQGVASGATMFDTRDAALQRITDLRAKA